MKTTIIGLLLLATASVNAQEKAQTYQWQMLPATVRRRDMDMISSLLPKRQQGTLLLFCPRAGR